MHVYTAETNLVSQQLDVDMGRCKDSALLPLSAPQRCLKRYYRVIIALRRLSSTTVILPAHYPVLIRL